MLDPGADREPPPRALLASEGRVLVDEEVGVPHHPPPARLISQPVPRSTLLKGVGIEPG